MKTLTVKHILVYKRNYTGYILKPNYLYYSHILVYVHSGQIHSIRN